MTIRRVNVPGPRTVRAPREQPTITLDDLFPATRSSELTARLEAEAHQQRRRTVIPRRPLRMIQAATRVTGPHETLQEPVDIDAVMPEPVGDILSKARATVRPARSNDYLHVSDLLHRCMRAFALQESLQQTPPAQQLRLADQLTYSQGDAIAAVIVSAVQGVASTALWGNWRCLCKRTQTTVPCTYAEVTAHAPCEHCLQPVDNYVEVPMFNEEYKIVGNPDILLYLAQFDAFHIVELKSITPNEFPDLVRAKPEHVLQAIFYWWLMHRLGYRLTTKVSITYLNKGHSFRGNPYKEFVIDVASQVSRLDMFLEEALALKAYREGRAAMPPRTRCNTPDDSQAKKCHVCQACFSSVAGASRRQVIDLSTLGDDGSTPTPPEPDGRTASAIPGRRPPPGPTRPSRIPGAPAVPLGSRSVPRVHGVRVPPPRRR